MLKLIFLVLSFGPFLSVKCYELPHPLYPIIKESSYQAIEYPEIFGIEPNNPGVQSLNCFEQMAPIFAGVEMNPNGYNINFIAARQKLSRGGITEEEMLYL